MLVLLEAQEGNWDELDLMIRAFQQANMTLRYSPVPVVAAPAGLSLGGGTEIPLHCDRVQAAAETYMGLVEVGVGLIPGGGGTKEMLVRAMAQLPTPQSDPLPYVSKAFETVALAKVSASGPDAMRPLSCADRFGHDEPRAAHGGCQGQGARARARGLSRAGAQDGDPVGGESVTAALNLGVHLMWRAGRRQRSRQADRAKARAHFRRRQLCRIRRRSASSTCSISSGRLHEPARPAKDARAESAHAQDRQAVA
jgi:3-hydroxyacyl-CoA dehydrogenase